MYFKHHSTLTLTCTMTSDPAEIDAFALWPSTLMENQTFQIRCNMQAHPYATWSIFNNDTGDRMIAGNVSGDVTVSIKELRKTLQYCNISHF